MEGDQPACKIRSMLPGDVIAVAAIEAQVNPSPWSEKQFRAELENPCSHIDLLISGDKIAGYICSWQIAGELEIQNIATGPDFRRQGFAGKLLQTVIDRAMAAAVSRVFLEVRAGNLPAQALYEKFGFACCGVRAQYYADKEDALLMEMNIGTGD